MTRLGDVADADLAMRVDRLDGYLLFVVESPTTGRGIASLSSRITRPWRWCVLPSSIWGR